MKKDDKLEVLIEPETNISNSFQFVSNSQSIQNILSSLFLRDELKDRHKELASDSVSVSFETVDNTNYGLMFKTPTTKTQLELNKSLCHKKNTLISKLFLIALAKVQENVLKNGELIEKHIEINVVDDLVKTGKFDSAFTAKRAVTRWAEMLFDMKIRAQVKIGKKKFFTKELIKPFIDLKWIGNKLRIGLHPEMEWRIFTAFATVLPNYWTTLSQRALALEHLIVSRAKQLAKRSNIKLLENEATGIYEDTLEFNIMFPTIATRLCLPNTADNVTHLCITPFEKAIEEIEVTHSEKFKNMDIDLLIMYDNEPIEVVEARRRNEYEKTSRYKPKNKGTVALKRLITFSEYKDHVSLRVRIRGEMLKIIMQKDIRNDNKGRKGIE